MDAPSIVKDRSCQNGIVIHLSTSDHLVVYMSMNACVIYVRGREYY